MREPRFKRVLQKIRNLKLRDRKQISRIRELQEISDIAQRKNRELEDKLRRLVSGNVANYGWEDCVTLCVRVDKKTAQMSYDGLIWEMAAKQLIEDLRKQVG